MEMTSVKWAKADQSITVLKNQTLEITSPNRFSSVTTLMPEIVRDVEAGQAGVISFSIEGGSDSASIDQSTGLVTPIMIGTVMLNVKAYGDKYYAPSETTRLINIDNSGTDCQKQGASSKIYPLELKQNYPNPA